MLSATQTYSMHSARRASISRTSSRSSRLVGFIILAIMALLYIAQSSQASTKSVEVQSLRQQADTLTNEADLLRLAGDRAKTLDMLSTQASPLGLVPVTESEFLK